MRKLTVAALIAFLCAGMALQAAPKKDKKPKKDTPTQPAPQPGK